MAKPDQLENPLILNFPGEIIRHPGVRWRVKFKETFHFTIWAPFIKYDTGKILDLRNQNLELEFKLRPLLSLDILSQIISKGRIPVPAENFSEWAKSPVH